MHGDGRGKMLRLARAPGEGLLDLPQAPEIKSDEPCSAMAQNTRDEQHPVGQQADEDQEQIQDREQEQRFRRPFMTASGSRQTIQQAPPEGSTPSARRYDDHKTAPDMPMATGANVAAINSTV